MMLLRATTLPSLAKRVSSAGLGAAASSGGLPDSTLVVRTASWSRVLSYSTLMPVSSSNGFKTAMKAPSPAQRAEAILELGKTPHAKTASLIVPLLTTDLVPVRQAAAKALGSLTCRARRQSPKPR